MTTRSPRSGASSGTWPDSTQHSTIQWCGERGDHRDQEEALKIAFRVDVTRPDDADPYEDADEVRFYKSGPMNKAVLFIIIGGRVLTPRPVSDTDFLPQHLDECSGCGGVHEIVLGQKCPYCSPEVRRLTEV